MHKLFSLKLISKNPRKFASETLRSNSFPLHRTTDVPTRYHHHGFSHYTTSPQPLQQAPTNCLMKVLSNPVLIKQVLPNAISKLKVPRKFLADHGGFEFLRAQFSRQNFQFNRSVSLQKTWLSQFRRRLTTDNVVIGLIATNVAVFLLWNVADRRFMMQNFMIQLDNVKSGRFHTTITSAFSHYSIGHLFSNMVGLYFFGTSISRNFGPEFLLKLYLAGAFVGSVFFLAHHAFLATSSKDQRASNIRGLGASGAVNAIMLLDILLFPSKTIYLEFIIPVPAMLMGMFIVGYDIVRIYQGDDQISGSAHLGGAAVAAIAWARLRKGRF